MRLAMLYGSAVLPSTDVNLVRQFSMVMHADSLLDVTLAPYSLDNAEMRER